MTNEDEYILTKEEFFKKNSHLKEFANIKLLKRKKKALLTRIHKQAEFHNTSLSSESSKPLTDALKEIIFRNGKSGERIRINDHRKEFKGSCL